jgi:hypothetical protein
MAHYIKYEIFLPVDYTDRATGERRALNRSSLLRFLFHTVRRYSGLTETNPVTAPPFKGYYLNRGRIEADRLITFMVLVPAEREEESLIYFTRWTARLEQKYNQEVILITYHPIQVIGQLG